MGNNCKGICYSNESATKSLADNLDNNVEKSKHSISRRLDNASQSGNNFSKNFNDSKNIKMDENGVMQLANSV